MMNSGVSGGLDPKQCVALAPFILVVDKRGRLTWASPSVLSRVRDPLGCELHRVLRWRSSDQEACIEALRTSQAKQCVFDLLGEQSRTPLTGHWISCGDGYALLARPDVSNPGQLGMFTSDELAHTTSILDVLVVQAESSSSLKAALSATTELKARNRELLAAREDLQNINAALLTQRSATQQSKERLQRAKEFLDAVINSIHEPLFVKDETHRWVLLNDAACGLMGRPREELLGSSDYDSFPKEQADLFWENDKKVLATGGPVISEEQVTWDGQQRTIRTSKSLYAEHKTGMRYIVGVIADITNRKAAEEDLRNAHLYSERLLASITSILVVIGEDGHITQWNRAAEQTFGKSAEDTVGRGLFDCGINWDSAVVRSGYERCRREERVERMDDVQFDRTDGSRGLLGITLHPVPGHADRRVGVLLLSKDLTERRALENQLLQAQKLESLGQLAAGIAHEINTPMQFVGDNLRFILESSRDIQSVIPKYRALLEASRTGAATQQIISAVEQAEQQSDMAYILEEIPHAVNQSLGGVERVSKIVMAMKEFSHPDTVEKELADVNRGIENTVTVSRNEWKYIANMELDLDPNVPPIPCLPGALNQAILNMIVNGAHAIAAVVGDGAEEKGTIKISTHCDGQRVEIRISDTGCGMPDEIKARIFDPFFTTKEVGKGTGQGLAIAHSAIVEKHGGTINLDTEVGRGTTFVIRLPICEIAEQAA